MWGERERESVCSFYSLFSCGLQPINVGLFLFFFFFFAFIGTRNGPLLSCSCIMYVLTKRVLVFAF